MLNIADLRPGMKIKYTGLDYDYGEHRIYTNEEAKSDYEWLMIDREKLYIAEITPSKEYFIKIPITKLNPAEWIIVK